MTKHFCCCIPVRFGVFVVALLSFGISALTAASIWYAVIRPQDVKDVNLTGRLKIALIIVGVVETISAIASLLGLIGALARKRALVSFFASFLLVSLLLHLALGINWIIQLVHHWHDTKETCVKKNNSNDDACIGGPAVKILSIVIFVVVMLINLYAVVIVRRYGTQLEEDSWDSPSKRLHSAPVPQNHPASHAMTNADWSHTASNTPYHSVSTHGDADGYPYAAPQHSFGNRYHV